MQSGFALLEAGSVRAKNTKNILLKNVLDACLGGIIWWTIGYPIALGDMGVGESKDNTGQPFFIDRIEGKSAHTYYAMWMFQWAFAATAATIVSVRSAPPLSGSPFLRRFFFFFFATNSQLQNNTRFFLLSPTPPPRSGQKKTKKTRHSPPKARGSSFLPLRSKRLGF